MEHSNAAKLSILSQFRDIVRDTSAFLSRHGIQKNPAPSPKNENLALQLDSSYLATTIRTARTVLEVHLEAERAGYDMDDSVNLARTALKTLGLLAAPEAFREIRRKDIVEIYNMDNIQIFRSFNFFRICNYNLDDLLLNKWYVLYERSPIITQALMDEVESHLKSLRVLTKFTTPTHPMKETFAEPQGVFMTRFKFITSVFEGPEKRAGFLNTLRARPIKVAPERISFIQ